MSTAADMPTGIAVINSAFAIETCLDGTRTFTERLSQMLIKGSAL